MRFIAAFVTLVAFSSIANAKLSKKDKALSKQLDDLTNDAVSLQGEIDSFQNSMLTQAYTDGVSIQQLMDNAQINGFGSSGVTPEQHQRMVNNLYDPDYKPALGLGSLTEDVPMPPELPYGQAAIKAQASRFQPQPNPINLPMPANFGFQSQELMGGLRFKEKLHKAKSANKAQKIKPKKHAYGPVSPIALDVKKKPNGPVSPVPL